MRKILVFSAVMVMIFAVSCKKKSQQAKLPSFSVEGLWGGVVTNSDLKDKVSIVEIWSLRCPHCIHQAQYLEDLAKDLDFSKYAIISIHGRGGNRVKRRVSQHFKNKKIKVGLDNGSVAKSLKDLPKYFHVRGIPHLMIVNKKGMIVEVLRGARKASKLKKILSKY